MKRWFSSALEAVRRRRGRHVRVVREETTGLAGGPFSGPATIPVKEVAGQPPWDISGELPAFLGRAGAPLDGTRPALLLPGAAGNGYGWVSGGGWPDAEDSGVWRRRMEAELAPEALAGPLEWPGPSGPELAHDAAVDWQAREGVLPDPVPEPEPAEGELAERLAHTWDWLTTITCEAVSAWAERIGAEIAGWRDEPWATVMPA